MTHKLYEEQNIQNIANAIREKNGTTTKYKTSEMAAAIRAIQSGGGVVETCTVSVTFDGPANDTFDCYYINGNSECKIVALPGTITNVQKNTLVTIYGCSAMYIASDAVTRMNHDIGTSVFLITGDGNIEFQG